MSSRVTLTWIMTGRSKSEEYTIYSERFKREVAEAHREFFKRRGMDPDAQDGGDFLFGSKDPSREDNLSWSQYSSDQPTSQSAQ